MRLIDANKAIEDANLNYGDVHDAVLMKHFLDSQPTVQLQFGWVDMKLGILPENLQEALICVQYSVKSIDTPTYVKYIWKGTYDKNKKVFISDDKSIDWHPEEIYAWAPIDYPNFDAE